ncbi:CLUMA_CG005694, isoform A [Clunio marinus]|uniref:CLUMA_CG005694, isoform A n=1 Tax=Clunio marinus TaxID=568069 RepID=A0A1J1HVW8_9DIPT|nr:CLUMA_CG005694, isoform A [Clunio marinus]
MRTYSCLFRQYRRPVYMHARAPQNTNRIPFKPILPIALRDQVSGKSDSLQSKVPCLHELSVLFAALKDNEFDEANCKREIDALKKAHVEAMEQAREDKLKNRGEIISTGTKLNSNQLNRYLRKFPSK